METTGIFREIESLRILVCGFGGEGIVSKASRDLVK